MTHIADNRRNPLRGAAALAALAALVLAFAAGCERTPARDFAAEGETWKTQINEAYERNQSLDNYRFEGSLAFENDSPAPSSETVLLPLLKDGLAWSGVHYREPLRLEADVRFGAADASSMNVPLLAQDGMLYVSIPSVNAADEYFAIALDGEPDSSGGPSSIRSALDAAGALDDLVRDVVTRVDPQWIRTANEDEAEAAEDAAEFPRRFVVEVTKENAAAVASAFQDGFAAWTAALSAVLGADSLGLTGVAPIRLAEGGSIELTLDENGYLVEQTVELAIRSEDGSEAETEAASARFSYSMRLSEPNGSPDMTKTVPANVIPFETVLAFLAAGQDAAKP